MLQCKFHVKLFLFSPAMQDGNEQAVEAPAFVLHKATITPSVCGELQRAVADSPFSKTRWGQKGHRDREFMCVDRQDEGARLSVSLAEGEGHVIPHPAPPIVFSALGEKLRAANGKLIEVTLAGTCFNLDDAFRMQAIQCHSGNPTKSATHRLAHFDPAGLCRCMLVNVTFGCSPRVLKIEDQPDVKLEAGDVYVFDATSTEHCGEYAKIHHSRPSMSVLLSFALPPGISEAERVRATEIIAPRMHEFVKAFQVPQIDSLLGDAE